MMMQASSLLSATNLGQRLVSSFSSSPAMLSWCFRRMSYLQWKALKCSDSTLQSREKIFTQLSGGLLSMRMRRNCSTRKSHSEEDWLYIPRRTLMFVPGHDPKKLEKIPKLGVDCAVLECEDGVALNMKAEARKNCKNVLMWLKSDGLDVALRINSVSSGLMKDDLTSIIGNGLGDQLTADRLPQTILVPKVNTMDELAEFTEMLEAVKLGRSYVPRLLIFTESAEGLMNLRDILRLSVDHSKNGHYRMDGVVFGSDDFCADIGAERSQDAQELIYARQKVVTLAKAFRLQAIDMVHVDIKDLNGLRKVSEEGARMGYTGKQVIHPTQVKVVTEAFTPSGERIDWATRLIQGFELHQKKGEGAFVFQGQMIDMPLLRQAQNVLRIVKRVE